MDNSKKIISGPPAGYSYQTKPNTNGLEVGKMTFTSSGRYVSCGDKLVECDSMGNPIWKKEGLRA